MTKKNRPSSYCFACSHIATLFYFHRSEEIVHKDGSKLSVGRVSLVVSIGSDVGNRAARGTESTTIDVCICKAIVSDEVTAVSLAKGVTSFDKDEWRDRDFNDKL